MDIWVIVSLLPLFFLAHELEEIIMMRSWIDRNVSELYKRFSKLKHIIVWMEQVTTLRFIMIAAEEFIIVSLCTLSCLYYDKMVLWYCCLAAFGIHLAGHLLQFIVWRRYIPAIATTFLCLPYCVLAISMVDCFFSICEMFIYALAGMAIGGLNLFIMHKIADKI